MNISARVVNWENYQDIKLVTGSITHSVDIPPKDGGYGSSANGGELLFLALASCYCNDIYREARNKGIPVDRVEVEVEGEFGEVGEPASRVSYRSKVTAQASQEEIISLMRHTDTVSEIQNTLRKGLEVKLVEITAEAVE